MFQQQQTIDGVHIVQIYRLTLCIYDERTSNALCLQSFKPECVVGCVPQSNLNCNFYLPVLKLLLLDN